MHLRTYDLWTGIIDYNHLKKLMITLVIDASTKVVHPDRKPESYAADMTSTQGTSQVV